jgi:hypothetical protein
MHDLNQLLGPAEVCPRSLALHLHLSMIPPRRFGLIQKLWGTKRARCARFVHVSRVVVPSNDPRNRAADWSTLNTNREAGGGGRRDRTDDILLAKQVLSQLSYAPKPARSALDLKNMVGQGGFEPPTSRLSSARSNQLSY